MMHKVGIMGGTFNPIHYGHLFLAEVAFEKAGLERVLFMPSNHPPHKTGIKVVSSEHRCKMVELAIEDNPHFELSKVEVNREGNTYTADTLRLLTKENPDCQYYFIVGADSLMDMPKWKEPQMVFQLSTIVAANRDHMNRKELEKQVEFLEQEYGARVLLIDIPTIGISSAQIRERIALNQTIRYYVPKEVIHYIHDQHVYTV